MRKTKETKVLVVDDEKEIRQILQKILGRKRYVTEAAENGTKALECLNHFRPDIVLLDIMMPELDGIETLKRIKGSHHDTIVIMVTAYGTIKTAREAMLLGAYDYITKPFDMDFIYQIIQESLKGRDELRKFHAA